MSSGRSREYSFDSETVQDAVTVVVEHRRGDPVPVKVVVVEIPQRPALLATVVRQYPRVPALGQFLDALCAPAHCSDSLLCSLACRLKNASATPMLRRKQRSRTVQECVNATCISPRNETHCRGEWSGNYLQFKEKILIYDIYCIMVSYHKTMVGRNARGREIRCTNRRKPASSIHCSPS